MEEAVSLILDVGCGDKPKGDVNVDLFPCESWHRRDPNRVLKLRYVSNFVRAEACHLPFRDNVFEGVVSHHVIEHVHDPKAMLLELIRVCQSRVEVKTPHHFGDSEKIKPHIQHFSKAWFVNVLTRLGFSHRVEYSEWRCFPHVFIPLMRLPCEITIEVWKA